MVETDDKDSVVPAPETKDAPAAESTPTEKPPVASEPENKTETESEAKETDKMLVEKSEDGKKDEKVDEGKEKTEEVAIDVPADAEGEKKDKPKKRKIPMGGIKLPEFLKKQPKNKNKSGDEGTELLENEKKDEEVNEEPAKESEPKPEEEQPPKEATPPSAGFFSKFKLSNPFAKKPAPATVDPEAPAEPAESEKPAEEEKKDEEKATEPETKVEPKDGEESKPEEKKEDAAPAEEPQPKKSLLSSIKLPQLSSIIPKRFQRQAQDDIELGNGPQGKAGLASMETLDDSLKDQDSKDTTDKSGETKSEPNGNGAKAEEEKAEKENLENDKNNTTLGQRIRGYKCSIDDLAIIAGIVLFLILVALILAFTFVGGAKEAKIAPVRDGKFVVAATSCGNVEGIYEDSGFAFRGIPYAKKPLDGLRFAPSQPIDNLDLCWNGTFQAHNATEKCLQLNSNGEYEGDEDCLTLDVVTPHVRYDNPLPVVVLIGAESLAGGSPNILRPSAYLSRARDVVFVRPNFRVNIFGFLAADQISKRSHPRTSGNYGLSDIITALVWVRDNIAHFGGDKNNVVLFGHRAGATLVTALVTSNKTNDLFNRAWISSASVSFPGKTIGESEQENKKFLDRLTCPEDRKDDCLYDTAAGELLKQVPGDWIQGALELPTPDEDTLKHHDWLVIDGEILKKDPREVLSKATNLPKLVFGSTAHNAHSELLYKKVVNWTAEQVRNHVVNSKIGTTNLTDEVLKMYGETYQGLVAMISDIRTVCPLYSLTKSIPKQTHFYYVSQTGGDLKIADQDIDIQTILGRFEPKTVEQRRYISSFQTLFYSFVSLGKIEKASPVLEVEQDISYKSTLPNCDFWIGKGFVPKYGRHD